MRRLRWAVSFLVLTAVFLWGSHRYVHAATDIEISGNGSNSHSSVSVSTHTSSTNGTSSGRTDVRIEQNGEVKEYHSDTPSDVHMQSSDGRASVQIQQKQMNASSDTPPPAPTHPDTAQQEQQLKSDIQARKEVLRQQQETLADQLTQKTDEIEQQHLSFFQFIKAQFDSLKKLFQFHFF